MVDWALVSLELSQQNVFGYFVSARLEPPKLSQRFQQLKEQEEEEKGGL